MKMSLTKRQIQSRAVRGALDQSQIRECADGHYSVREVGALGVDERDYGDDGLFIAPFRTLLAWSSRSFRSSVLCL